MRSFESASPPVLAESKPRPPDRSNLKNRHSSGTKLRVGLSQRRRSVPAPRMSEALRAARDSAFRLQSGRDCVRGLAARNVAAHLTPDPAPTALRGRLSALGHPPALGPPSVPTVAAEELERASCEYPCRAR